MHVRRRLAAQAERLGHAEQVVDSSGRVGIDGVGTGCFAYVHGKEVGRAAADDDDGGLRGEGGEGGRGNGSRKGSEVFLAILAYIERVSPIMLVSYY